MDRRYFVRAILVLLGAAVFGLNACTDDPRTGQPAPVSVAELAEQISAGTAPFVLDVRTREEYASGHIPGSVNIPHDELSGRMDELSISPSDEVVVSCRSGRRAAAAERVLADAGFTNVRDLEGHMQAWQRAGYPTE